MYLDSILQQMDFGGKLWNWIKWCLSSNRVSILVNEPPTNEFPIKRGVRQRDPLSPFLFIIAIEGHSVSLKEACNCHIFQGISLPHDGPYLSHLMYVDDVTFVGEWYKINLINLNRIFRCFYLAFSLRINLLKSKVFGIRVDSLDISRLASILHCERVEFPLTYLGLRIGENMKLAKALEVDCG